MLLDMLSNLKSLHAVPSLVEYWFWAAFHDPCAKDEAKPKPLPQGLLSLESLDVHYRDDLWDEGEVLKISEMNDGVGFAHIKLVSALLLPSLRTLSFSRDDGDSRIWQNCYVDDRWSSESVDMERLAGRSKVTHTELRGVDIVPDVLSQILSMLAAPEKVYFEQILSPLSADATT